MGKSVVGERQAQQLVFDSDASKTKGILAPCTTNAERTTRVDGGESVVAIEVVLGQPLEACRLFNGP